MPYSFEYQKGIDIQVMLVAGQVQLGIISILCLCSKWLKDNTNIRQNQSQKWHQGHGKNLSTLIATVNSLLKMQTSWKQSNQCSWGSRRLEQSLVSNAVQRSRWTAEWPTSAAKSESFITLSTTVSVQPYSLNFSDRSCSWKEIANQQQLSLSVIVYVPSCRLNECLR